MDDEEIKRRVIFGDKTGYGNPPKHSRFKKGASGNPKGRPKKEILDLDFSDQPTLKTIHKIAESKVTLREDGVAKQITMREAAVRAMFASATKGDSRAQALALRLTEQAEQAKAQEIRERIEIWKNYKSVMSDQIAKAKKKGDPVPHIVPHPDDIIIDYVKGPQFLGPMDDEQQADLEHTIRYRDTLMLQYAYDQRSDKRLNGEPLTEPGSAAVFAMMLDKIIPPRLRLSDAEWLYRTMKNEAIPKRVLAKQLYAAWRALGTPRPRGYVSVNLGPMQTEFCQARDFFVDLRSRCPDPSEVSNDEWNEIVRATIPDHFPD